MNAQAFQNFNPTSYSQTIVGAIFYIALILLTFFSLATMYVLLKNGRSKAVGLSISIVYLIFFMSLAAQAISSLNAIK